MKTGKLTIEVDYADDGSPEDVRVSGTGSGHGQLAAAGALITAACEGVPMTLQSGVLLMGRLLGWDWLEHALIEAHDNEDD